MKRAIIFGLCIVLAGCSGTPAVTTAPTTAAGASTTPTAPADLLAASWDQITALAKAEGKLTFYSWYFSDFYTEVAKRFKAAYGIDVTVVIGDVGANMDKALAEKDSAVGSIDAMDTGGQYVKTTMDAGIFWGPILPVLPSSGQLDSKLSSYQEGVDLKGFLVPIYRNQTAFLYDPAKVPNPPQTWDEFTAWLKANPKGFAYCDPNKGGTGQSFVQTVIANLTGGLDKYKGDTEVDPTKIANWNLAWDWLKTNNPNINVTLSNDESIDVVNTGAALLSDVWSDDVGVSFGKGTLFKSAKLYIPTMGLPGGGSTQGILKNAQNKAAALLWLDYLTSPDIQALMNKITGAIPARNDIPAAQISDLVPPDQRQYKTDWVPGAYKAEMVKEYTKFVLLQ
jgi:putative spermidine/putrescine transport system substrate-binding protein